MTRDQLIEMMARAIFNAAGGCYCDHPQCSCSYECEREDRNIDHHKDAATAVLTAIEAAGMRVVPVEPSEKMLATFHDVVQITVYPDEKAASIMNDRQVWEAMVLAAQEDSTSE